MSFPAAYYSRDTDPDYLDDELCVDRYDDEDSSDFCRHGYRHGQCAICNDDDAEIELRGGLDKCLSCGCYRYGDQLTADQVCVKPCRNPNEY